MTQSLRSLGMLIALSGMGLATLAAPVHAQSFNPKKVVRSVNTDDLVAIVGVLGHEVIERGEDGSTSVAARNGEGMIYHLIGTACDVQDVPGCQGIMMQVRYELPASVTYETLSNSNMDQAALNTWADFENRTLGFTRYQVLDHGVSMANIRENVSVLLSITPLAFEVATGSK